MARSVRFGYQITATDEADPIASARRAEDAGFDVVLGAGRRGITDVAVRTIEEFRDVIAAVRSAESR